jgi:hypothetical protein
MDMAKKVISDAHLQGALDALIVNPSITAAMAKVGVARELFYRWLRSDRRISWPDRTDTNKRLFHECYAHARRLSAIEFDARIRESVMLGDQVVATDPSGRIRWAEDPALLAEFARYGEKAAEVAGQLGVFDFPFVHKENDKGQLERVPLMIRNAAPATLRIHTARALLPGMNPASKQETTVDQKVASTVLVIGATQMPNLPPYHRDYVPPEPAQLEAPKPKSRLERLAELQTKFGGQQLSPLVQDLISRAGQPPTHPTPQGPSAVRGGSDDPPERITSAHAVLAEPPARPTMTVSNPRNRHPEPAPGGFKVS